MNISDGGNLFASVSEKSIYLDIVGGKVEVREVCHFYHCWKLAHY